MLHKLGWGVRSVGPLQTLRGGCRLALIELRRPERSQVVLRSGGVISFANPSQRAPALVVFGDVIDPELRLVRRVLRPGASVIDAGAAIGQFTVVAGQTAGATIHAYEPSSANVVSLRHNVDLNDLTARVVIHQAALSSYEGTAVFHTTENTYLSGLDDASDACAGQTVPVVRLSDELERLDIRHVDVLKVNVAGYEAEVLRGCLDRLRDGSVSMLIVLVGPTIVPVLREVHDMGYRFFFYDPYAVALHELAHLDERALNSPPTPARHVIGLHPSALTAGPLAAIPVRSSEGARV